MMMKDARCYVRSDSHSLTDKGRETLYGKDKPEDKGEQEAEVQGTRLHPVPAMRSPSLGLQEIWYLPRLLPRDGTPR
jgi:hypothetical protein